MTHTDDTLISVTPITSTPTHLQEFQEFHEWQLCPKCQGQGIVSKPPWIAGDVNTWCTSTTAPITCDLCNGKKIISKVNGQPPV